MFGLGTPELVVILAIAFLLFGGKKLPEIGAGLGKAIRSFKNGLDEVENATGMEGIAKKLPGVREAVAVQEKIDQVKDIGKLLTK
jgi:sec-independent protein translocase protein TatA